MMVYLGKLRELKGVTRTAVAQPLLLLMEHTPECKYLKPLSMYNPDIGGITQAGSEQKMSINNEIALPDLPFCC